MQGSAAKASNEDAVVVPLPSQRPQCELCGTVAPG